MIAYILEVRDIKKKHQFILLIAWLFTSAVVTGRDSLEIKWQQVSSLRLYISQFLSVFFKKKKQWYCLYIIDVRIT